MNHHDNFDDFLTQQLRDNSAYLPDDGFSAGVMAQLTPPQTLSRRAARLIIGIPLLLISALVFSQLPWQETMTLISQGVQVADPIMVLKLGALSSLGILLGCCAWLARQLRWI